MRAFEGFSGASAQEFGVVVFWLLLLSPVFIGLLFYEQVYKVYESLKPVRVEDDDDEDGLF